MWLTRQKFLVLVILALVTILIIVVNRGPIAPKIIKVEGEEKEVPPYAVAKELKDLPPGLKVLPTNDIKVTLSQSSREAEDNFYKYVTQKQVDCAKTTRMGNRGDGGWDMCVIPEFQPKEPCIVYSFGINNDWSFDDEVSSQYKCQVKAFDPSMRIGDHKHSAMVWFYHTGIGGKNTVNGQGWKIRTLESLFKQLGDDEKTIDFLKMDIEYNEWDSFRAMFEEGALKNVKQFAFEIHTHELGGGTPTTVAQFYQYYQTLKSLENLGFRKFHYHWNPFGNYRSQRTGQQRTCCYELYYINMNLVNQLHKNPITTAKPVVTTIKPVITTTAVSAVAIKRRAPEGLLMLPTTDYKVTIDMSAVDAENNFYSFVRQNHVTCSTTARMGNTGDGGWDMCLVPAFRPDTPCTVYSFGINNDWSFDDAISRRYGCTVRAFDPSMHVGDHKHSSLVWFYQTGIGGTNTVNGQGWKIRTLKTLVTEYGDNNKVIDYLKIDIEYNEWDSFRAMFEEGALKNVKQFGFEIHTHELAGGSPTTVTQFVSYYKTLKALEDAGFRRYHFHFNPFGQYHSQRTGKQRTCCYELYYINTRFLDGQIPMKGAPVIKPKAVVTTAAPAASNKAAIVTQDQLPRGLTLLEARDVKVTSSMTPQEAEEKFYSSVTFNHLKCDKVERIGNYGDGGWDMCLVSPYTPKSSCTVYSFGINNDWSFDDAVSSRYKCTVRAFDPSMRMGDHKHSNLVWFYHTGIGGKNSFSGGWKIRTLASLMKQLGDEKKVIDYLKIDIEYNEWDSFKAMFDENALKNVKQFGFEIHTHELAGGSPTTVSQFVSYYNTLKALEDIGFRRYHFHFNPLGGYDSRRTGKHRTCCYELYYLNMNFVNGKIQNAPAIGEKKEEKAVAKVVDRGGIKDLDIPEITLSTSMDPRAAEEAFYRYVTTNQISCPEKVRMGHWADGGWDMCVSGPFKPQSPCTVYSFGINNDWSFDDAVSKQYGCKVKAFDPSMHVGDHKHSAMVWFYQTGIGGTNMVDSHGWKIRTLRTLLKDLGDLDKTIEYLKIDIEYNEWNSFEAIFAEGALKNVKQFGFEIHTHELGGGSATTVPQFYSYYKTIKALRDLGFKQFHNHFNPLGQYNSARTGKRKTCCYEIYYINTHFLDGTR